MDLVFVKSCDLTMLQSLQRDMAERGHSLESIKASIEARKPDFDAYIGKISLLP